jgi:hypothetical protein
MLDIDTHSDMWHPVRMASASQALDTSAWPTQAEAALQIGTGERTIRRWIDARRLKSALRPVAGRKPLVIVDPVGVAQLREERRGPVVLREEVSGTEPVSNDTAPGTGLARTGEFRQFEDFARLFATIKNARSETKVWLTLDEAVPASGLTRKWLLAWAESGAGAIAVRDMGRGARGGRWRFSREGLTR